MKLSELLKTEDQWTQHTNARDRRGMKVDPLSENAVKWCLLGGFVKCFHNEENARFKLLRLQDLTKKDITDFNDESTFEDVRALIEKFENETQ